MILVLRTDASQPQIDHAIERVQELGFEPRVITGAFRTIIALIGDDNAPGVEKLDAIPGVEHVHRILKPFKLASREFHKPDTVVLVGKVRVGGGHLAMIAGPCAVENFDGLDTIAGHVKKAGANILRGGAFKPRTSPYAFQGMGEEGLKILRDVGDIRENNEGLAAERADLRFHSLDFVMPAFRMFGQHEVRPRVGEAQRNGASDSLRCAGDDGDFAGKSEAGIVRHKVLGKMGSDPLFTFYVKRGSDPLFRSGRGWCPRYPEPRL